MQPIELFDGTSRMELVEAPVESFKESFFRFNSTHKLVTTYSSNGTIIGPTALDFFPKRYKLFTYTYIFTNYC
jgi:hypothetical protein